LQIITIAGPPSSGKTSVIIKTLELINKSDISIGVVKFDCLTTNDDQLYKDAGIKALKGLSGVLCPDHYFVSNLDEVIEWGNKNSFTSVIIESAGLCNRCSPHLKSNLAVCVVDNMSGINTPQKIGPMLKLADIVVITKGDIVSQAEREVFAFRVQQVAPRATIIHVNGRNGQGAFALLNAINNINNINTKNDTNEPLKLRFPMPAALCSYCLGETRVGADYQIGQFKKLEIE
jgi:Ni2+-binding GTPase involved in maturation of urease and hydrogenase